MMSSFVKYPLLMVVVLFTMQELEGCLEKERLGLLELKAFFVPNSRVDNDEFSSWVDNDKFSSWVDNDKFSSWVDDKDADCCVWEYVKCNHNTTHVMDLLLGDVISLPVRLMNFSFIRPFKQLVHLNLSFNSFYSWDDIEGLCEMKNLQELDLGMNEFIGHLPQCLSQLTDLKVLGLSSNYFNGNGDDIEGLCKMKNLQELDLGKNEFSGHLPQCLSQLTDLKVLGLSSNNFYGNGDDIEGLCKMKNLQELDLSWNSISGHLPHCLGQLTNLRVLDLSSNYFNGNVPPFINSIKSLEYLSLFDNMFDGIFSFSSLTNHSNLEVFSLSSTTNNFHVETEDQSWLPTFQLKVLQLQNCNLNSKRNGSIPSFLLYQHELRIIDLSHNKLEGEFPSWLLQNNSKLEIFYLMNNTFTGTLKLPTFEHGLLQLQVSNNKIGGQLPNNIGDIFSTLFYVNLSKNSFEGILPSSMGEMQTIKFLDLSYNNFSGELTTHLLSNWSSLLLLRLSNNSFLGPIIPVFSKLTGLRWLFLNNNNFSGEIEGGASNISMLYTLDLSNNKISGRIPRWIRNSTKLKVLFLSKNKLEGEIPDELCNLSKLLHLDLSENNLTGYLPSCFNDIRLLTVLYLQKNALEGYVPYVLSKLTGLVSLDLRDNNFSGNIPHWINNLSQLGVLLLAGNKLTGSIPHQICQLEHVQMMDLSRNWLTEAIPSCLYNISFQITKYSYQLSSFNGETIYFDEDVAGFIPGITFPTFYNCSLSLNPLVGDNYMAAYEQVEVEFRTKSYYHTYKGVNLDLMIGLDLSSNKLSGSIPPEIGELREIHSLNLSHNQLSGSIPVSFSNLRDIESLDLSYNNLSSAIPPNMSELYSLAIFNVSYNNLSGIVPSTSQFATFDENNYIGNSYLCGSVLNRSCTRTIESPPTSANKLAEHENGIDMGCFYWGFIASFITVVIGLAAILWINSHWSRAWFKFVDLCIFYCFSRCLNNAFH